MTATRLLARPLLASTFFVGAVAALRNTDTAAEQAEPVTEKLMPLADKVADRVAPQASLPHDPKTLVRINAGVQLAAAAALATGKAPRLASTVLAASIVPTTVAGHRFWEESEPAARKQAQLHFFKNTSLLGGLLLAAVDTEGKPGLAWRARRAAKDVRREARHAQKAALREAKLAKKSVA